MFRASVELAVCGCVLGAAQMLAQDAPKRLTKPEAAAAIAHKVQPQYNAVAQQLKLEGQVELEAMLSEDGSVEDVRVVSGNPVLTRIAVEAVKKWKFTPITEGGKPVKALAPVALVFTRSEK